MRWKVKISWSISIDFFHPSWEHNREPWSPYENQASGSPKQSSKKKKKNSTNDEASSLRSKIPYKFLNVRRKNKTLPQFIWIHVW